MNDRFMTLRAAVQKFLDQPDVSIDAELIEFRNAASVLTIDELLHAYDSATATLDRLTEEGPLGALSVEEIELISAFRTVGKEGREFLKSATKAAAEVCAKKQGKVAEVVELRPKE